MDDWLRRVAEAMELIKMIDAPIGLETKVYQFQ